MSRIAISACLVFFSFVADVPYVQAEQPNVLWIVTDDQRFDSIQAFN